MRRIIPVIVGVVLLLVGIGWAAQGAGVIGGSSLMDKNTIFVFLGGIIAVLGIGLVAYGAVVKPKAQVSAAM